MSFTGNWDIVLHTPISKQKGTMTVAVEENVLTGDINTPLGIVPIKEGRVDGNSAYWSCDLVKPIAMKLEFSVTADGDSMEGKVKVGPMGTNKFEGTRNSQTVSP